MPYKDREKNLLYWKKRYERNRNPNTGNKNPMYTLCETCGEPIRTCMSRVLAGKAIFCSKHRYDGMKNLIPWNKGTKGIMPIPWNKGMRTAKHPKDKEYQEYRLCSEYMDWRKKCLKRDLRLCQLCGTKKKAEVHHIKSYKDYPEERISIDNGITLCRSCHMWVHTVNPLDFQ